MQRLTIALALSIASLSFAPRASAQGILFSDGFENGLGNWTATGLWTLENQFNACGAQTGTFPEGQYCAYYGIGSVCNYDTGALPNHGYLTLNVPVLLPAGGPAASLHCWTYHQTETCLSSGNSYDIFNIEVSSNGGATWTVVGVKCVGILKAQPISAWYPRGIDLSAYLGQSILVRFRFDTVDQAANFYLGAFVDHVEIRQEAGKPFCAGACPCLGPYNYYYGGWGNMTGCTNSQHRDGELAGRGIPSVASDSVVLHATELITNTVAIFLQADTHSAGAFSGDGLGCLTGTLVRLAVRGTDNGAVAFPAAGDPPLSVAGAVPTAGGRKHYQVLYRDNGAYCTSAQFNYTNGYTISWSP